MHFLHACILQIGVKKGFHECSICKLSCIVFRQGFFFNLIRLNLGEMRKIVSSEQGQFLNISFPNFCGNPNAKMYLLCTITPECTLLLYKVTPSVFSTLLDFQKFLSLPKKILLQFLAERAFFSFGLVV